MRTLTVQTPSHQYPIFIGHKLIEQADTLLQPYLGKKAAIITNETVAPLYLKQLQTALDRLGVPHFSIILPDGEEYKNWQTLNLIYDGLMQNRAERKTTLIALGGGVIGDMVGFAAATYQRGAPFIQVPTTLLSQVDSSVGGKTAINHPLGKNMIGAFYQPQAVLADLTALQTLPQRELSAGMAEVIKYGALGDAEFFAWLEENMADLMAQHQEKMAEAVYHCCKMKADIVAQDETEQGIREGVRQVMLPLWNVYHFFALYANAANNGEGYSAKLKYDSQHVMDRFILGKTRELIEQVTAAMDY